MVLGSYFFLRTRILERFTGTFESNLSPLSSFLHLSEAMLTYVMLRQAQTRVLAFGVECRGKPVASLDDYH